MTNSAYPGLTQAEDLFKTLVWDPLIKSLAFATFGVSIFGSVLTYVATSFSDILYGQIRLLIDVEAIALVNAQHKIEYKNASLKLKVIAHDKGSNSPEYFKAREEAMASLAKFVSFGSKQ